MSTCSRLADQLAAGQTFTVEETEPGKWQAVFPEALSEYSAVYDDPRACWMHIAEVLAEGFPDVDTPA